MPRIKTGDRVDHEHTPSGEKLALMAVFANPDQEVFSPAGTLARYASEGIRVAVVTATREQAPVVLTVAARATPALALPPRDKSCSCLTSGAQRICLLDYPGGKIDMGDEALMLERLVRLVREQQPQVIVTYGPEGLGDPDHPLICRLTTSAFEMAGDSTCYPEHLADALMPYQPKKLYYSILPQSAVTRWGALGMAAVPDAQITTVVDVSRYTQSKLRTLYCHRNHVHDYARWLQEDTNVQWDQEYFVLAASRLKRKLRKEQDLFTGLR
ncbi:MAG: PIG-L family deacetylase [Anaerolineae bacterium]